MQTTAHDFTISRTPGDKGGMESSPLSTFQGVPISVSGGFEEPSSHSRLQCD